MRKFKRLLACVFAFTLTTFAALAQTETGQITGTVLDPTGAVVPNAKVIVKIRATGLTRETTSTGTGTYSVTNLQPGTYTVSASAPGFSTLEEPAQVTVGAKVGLDLHLELGRPETVVQVSETAGLLNTETQTLSENVT